MNFVDKQVMSIYVMYVTIYFTTRSNG